MKIFNKFRETIFLKNDSSLKNEIEYLKEILKKDNSNKERLEKKLNLLEAGLLGENNIEYELKIANIGMYVLHDITFKYEDLTAQIDYVVVTAGYTYLIECKNLFGDITINSNGEFIRTRKYKNQTITEAIYSPYTQALRHKEILKKIWIKNRSNFTTYFFEKSFDIFYKPLVVIANAKSIIDIENAPSEIKNNVVKIDQLINYIKNDINNYNKDALQNQKQMLETANNLLERSTLNSNYDFSKKYIDDSNVDKVLLKNKLIDFRREKSIKMNKPAYYIFNNKELEKILELMPKDINILKSSKILSDIKIQCHGKDIINIINNFS